MTLLQDARYAAMMRMLLRSALSQSDARVLLSVMRRGAHATATLRERYSAKTSTAPMPLRYFHAG